MPRMDMAWMNLGQVLLAVEPSGRLGHDGSMCQGVRTHVSKGHEHRIKVQEYSEEDEEDAEASDAHTELCNGQGRRAGWTGNLWLCAITIGQCLLGQGSFISPRDEVRWAGKKGWAPDTMMTTCHPYRN